MLILKPSKILRLTKNGKLPDHIKGGHPKCLKCSTIDILCGTESPAFWENGTYCFCKNCKKWTLFGAVYPNCPGYPEGIEVDISGERKHYPKIMKPQLD